MEKKCPRCNTNKNLLDFYPDSKRKFGRTSWCKKCHSDYRKEERKNPKRREFLNERNRKYLKSEEHKKWLKEYRKSGIFKAQRKRYRQRKRGFWLEFKIKIFSKFGGKCGHCGNTDPRVLQIDHVNGGGRKELKKTKNIYQYYKNSVLPDTTGKYQLLCANCNWIKRSEKREVPNQNNENL